MRASLLVTALALGCLWACSLYAPAECTSPCGVTFTGDDCAGFAQLEARTVRAFGPCDAGSPDDACAALSGWTVRVLPESQTKLRDDAGDREFPAPPNDEGVTEAFGQTDCSAHIITLADEHWPSGVAATELIHAATSECSGNPYPLWPTNGRACVRDTAMKEPLVLTGSNGDSP